MAHRVEETTQKMIQERDLSMCYAAAEASFEAVQSQGLNRSARNSSFS